MAKFFLLGVSRVLFFLGGRAVGHAWTTHFFRQPDNNKRDPPTAIATGGGAARSPRGPAPFACPQDADPGTHDFTTECQFFDRDPRADSHGAYLTDPSVPAGQWATRGCRPTAVGAAAVTCACDHLTEFRSITAFLPKPNLVSLGDLVNVVRMNSPIIW